MLLVELSELAVVGGLLTMERRWMISWAIYARDVIMTMSSVAWSRRSLAQSTLLGSVVYIYWESRPEVVSM